jgi:hypothetical protein
MSLAIATFRDIADTEKTPDAGGGLSLIEHLRNLSLLRCKNPKAPILFGDDPDTHKSIVIRSACDQWSCPSCGARNARYWIAKIVNGMNKIGGQWYFMTITAHENDRTVEGSLKCLRQGWRRLRDKIVYKFGKFDYFKVYEHHEDGAFHLHLMTNVQIPYTETKNELGGIEYRCKWLKDAARDCDMGWKADFQPLRSPAGGAYYLAKYLTKSIGTEGHDWPKNLRRVQCSQSWPKLKDLTEESTIEWSYVQNQTQLWYMLYLSLDEGNTLYNNVGMKASVAEIMNWFRQQKGEVGSEHGNTENASGVDGNPASSGTHPSEGTQEENAQRQDTGQSITHDREPYIKSGASGTTAYFTVTANENEGILNHDRPKTAYNIQKPDNATGYQLQAGNGADDPCRKERLGSDREGTGNRGIERVGTLKTIPP